MRPIWLVLAACGAVGACAPYAAGYYDAYGPGYGGPVVQGGYGYASPGYGYGYNYAEPVPVPGPERGWGWDRPRAEPPRRQFGGAEPPPRGRPSGPPAAAPGRPPPSPGGRGGFGAPTPGVSVPGNNSPSPLDQQGNAR